MWEVLAAIPITLGCFTLCIRLCLSTFQSLLAKATETQAQALAVLVAPMFKEPVPTETLQRDLEDQVALPHWLESADSPDLVEDWQGRPLTWQTPVIPEEDSVGPGDLWSQPGLES